MARNWTDKCKAFLLDIFFPNRCPFCGEIIRWDMYSCAACREKFIEANGKICRKCGKHNCSCVEGLNYDMAFASCFFGSDGVNKAVYDFKHIGDTNIAYLTAEDAAEYMKAENIAKPDIIVPVPMGRKKQRRRGHNQAELLGRCIGKTLDIPVRSDILYKYDTEDEQHKHTREEREKRVKELFYVGEKRLSDEESCVLLCDDVMTTGSTINECARLLKEIGAKKVIAVVCAVTKLEKEEA